MSGRWLDPAEPHVCSLPVYDATADLVATRNHQVWACDCGARYQLWGHTTVLKDRVSTVTGYFWQAIR